MGLRRFPALAPRVLLVAVPLQLLVGLPLARALERVDRAAGADATAAAVALGCLFFLVWFLALVPEVAVVGRAAVRSWLLGVPNGGPAGLFAGAPPRPAAAPADAAPDTGTGERAWGPVAGALVIQSAAAYGALIASIAVIWAEPGAGVLLLLFLALPLALWLGTLFAFAPLEAGFGAGPVRALGNSRRLSKGSFWRVVGVTAAAQLIVATTLLVPAVVLFMVHPAGGAGLMIYMVTYGVVLETLAAPFRGSVLAALWVDLRVRREGLDLEMRLDPLRAADALSRR